MAISKRIPFEFLQNVWTDEDTTLKITGIYYGNFSTSEQKNVIFFNACELYVKYWSMNLSHRSLKNLNFNEYDKESRERILPRKNPFVESYQCIHFYTEINYVEAFHKLHCIIERKMDYLSKLKRIMFFYNSFHITKIKNLYEFSQFPSNYVIKSDGKFPSRWDT